MLVWIIAVVLLGVLFGVGIERLLAKLGIQREQPDEPVTVVRDFRTRVETWQQKQAAKQKRDRPRR
jgi:hypothetical protein